MTMSLPTRCQAGCKCNFEAMSETLSLCNSLALREAFRMGWSQPHSCSHCIHCSLETLRATQAATGATLPFESPISSLTKTDGKFSRSRARFSASRNLLLLSQSVASSSSSTVYLWLGKRKPKPWMTSFAPTQAWSCSFGCIGQTEPKSAMSRAMSQ